MLSDLIITGQIGLCTLSIFFTGKTFWSFIWSFIP